MKDDKELTMTVLGDVKVKEENVFFRIKKYFLRIGKKEQEICDKNADEMLYQQAQALQRAEREAEVSSRRDII